MRYHERDLAGVVVSIEKRGGLGMVERDRNKNLRRLGVWREGASKRFDATRRLRAREPRVRTLGTGFSFAHCALHARLALALLVLVLVDHYSSSLHRRDVSVRQEEPAIDQHT